MMTIHEKAKAKIKSKDKNKDEEKKDDKKRLLTPGETELSRAVFQSTIEYQKVWIHRESYLPFGLQNKDTAMVPDGEIYFPEHYREDYSLSVPFYQHMFP